VLKVCRTPGPTACLKMLSKVCLESWRRRKKSMTGPRQPWTCSHPIYTKLPELVRITLAISVLISSISATEYLHNIYPTWWIVFLHTVWRWNNFPCILLLPKSRAILIGTVCTAKELGMYAHNIQDCCFDAN